MILKIERYGKDQDWWMLDDIRKISKSKAFVADPTKDYDADVVDMVILDYVDQVIREDGAQNLVLHIESISLICRLSNGEEYSIIFDTTAYLCNDEGKTIEKIVANYKD